MNIHDDIHDDEVLGRAIGEALRHCFTVADPPPAAHPLWLEGRRLRRRRLVSVSIGTGVTATAAGVATVLAMSGGAATPGAPASVVPGTTGTTATTTSAPAASTASVPPGATAGPDANHRYCYYRAPADGTPKLTDDWCFETRQEIDAYASNQTGRHIDSNPSLLVTPPHATPHPADGASRPSS